MGCAKCGAKGTVSVNCTAYDTNIKYPLNKWFLCDSCYRRLTDFIINKPHGRLVDADALAENIAAARYEVDGKYEEGLYLAWSIINDEDATPTVIPEDEEEKHD